MADAPARAPKTYLGFDCVNRSHLAKAIQCAVTAADLTRPLCPRVTSRRPANGDP